MASRPMTSEFCPHNMQPDLNSLSLTIDGQGVSHNIIIIIVVIFIIIGVSSIIEVRRLWATRMLHFLSSYTPSQGIRELASLSIMILGT